MTKKIFAQPEMMVVNMKHNDIVTTSDPKYFNNQSTNATSGNLAPGMRGLDDWDAGY